MQKNDKILITGSTGLLGSALVKNLRDKKFKKLILINSKKINLTNLNSIKRLLLKQKPKYIFHCANKVFGFGGNQSNKFEMLNENLLINSNLLKAVLVTKVKKILFVGSTAVYNEKLKYNISEDKIDVEYFKIFYAIILKSDVKDLFEKGDLISREMLKKMSINIFT